MNVVELKETIVGVLEGYTDSQLNIDSEVGRDMVADDIVDAIRKVYLKQTKEGWINGEL